MKSTISGVIVRKLVVHRDQRGWLTELFRNDELEGSVLPKMGYVSVSHPGITRGPHEHREQVDHFAFIGSSSFRLYLWDNRADSATFGRSDVIECTESDPIAVLIPAGVVHAYRNVGQKDGIVLNFPNRLYAGAQKKETADEIRHEDGPHSRFQIEE